MSVTGNAKSQVSRPSQEIDERVGAALARLIEVDRFYLWLDAT